MTIRTFEEKKNYDNSIFLRTQQVLTLSTFVRLKKIRENINVKQFTD